MEHLNIVRKYLTEPGVEIGAFRTPIPGIRPVYVDRFAQYANEKTLAYYYGDACDLPFEDSSLAYVATSHLIEHVANPLAALKEWYRVLWHGGIIYMVVPDRRRTFDHTRALTPMEDMVGDFRRGVTQVNGTHIDDFVFGVDWSLFSPATPPDKVKEEREKMAGVYRAAIAAGNEINIHFHTFEPESMRLLIEETNRVLGLRGRIDIVDSYPNFPASRPDGFLIVAKVKKSPLEHLTTMVRMVGNRRYALKPHAKKF